MGVNFLPVYSRHHLPALSSYCRMDRTVSLVTAQSPIHRCPPEILVMIFRLFLATSGGHLPSNYLVPLFVLSALHRAFMRDILSRSASLPLSLTLDMISPLHEARVPGTWNVPFAFGPLRRVRDRLEYMVLTFDAQDVLGRPPSLPTFPKLTSLDITVSTCDDSEVSVANVLEFFKDSPALDTLSLTFDTSIPWTIPELHFHWNQLTAGDLNRNELG
ncbi:hypothetical protein FB45DRAFT_1036299 [Roridomyces roridus]|uniref:Uncharacterized protein n=1 Tax=Roridomyces roridus TaxID=1738132 RepID=A0AAD7B944_9AGAR|nr:hypothetical protein FB45DRAFT_1036299 [Roridomyces roridus]